MLPTALLTLPPPGDRTFATLDRKVRLLTLEALLRADPHRLEPELARALPRVQALVKEIARRHRGALLEALAVPEVRAPLLVLRAGLRPPDPLLRTAVPALLLALSARSALGSNRSTIEIVHLLGGTDHQIARVFQRSVGFDAALGAGAGLLLGMVAVLVLGQQFAQLGSGMVAGGGLDWTDWLAVAMVPLAAVALAMLTARLTVLFALRKML